MNAKMIGMKKVLLYGVLALGIAVTMQACKEVGPDINLGNNENVIADTTYVESPVAAVEQKNVVIEEFTGVRCPNCPQGHVIINNLKTQNPGKIVAISLHPINSLGAPYSFSIHDFRSQDAQGLFDYLGQIGLQPAAGIDRMKFGGENAVLLDKSKWQTRFNEELAIAPPVNVLLEKTYDSTNRELTIVAEVHYTQTITEENKLTVLLTESGMVTPQLDGSIIDTFYVHKDIMRTYITATQGDQITTTREAGRVVRRVYKKVLDAAWKPENMYIVAFVHEYVNSKRVYQGKEIHIID